MNWYWILPNNILYDESLNDKAKLLYVTLSSLCAEKGYCWATNDYLAQKYNVSSRTISRRVSELANHLSIIYIDKGKKTERRIISLDKSVLPPRQKCPTPLDKNVQHISISNNIINNNSVNNSVNNIYTYYIEQINRFGKYEMKYNKKALSLERIKKALINEKSTEEEMKLVIDSYINHSRDNIKKGYAKMCQYFFWPIERGSKIMFYQDFLEQSKEQKQKPIINLSTLEF